MIFDFQCAQDGAEIIRKTGRLFLTGEGSSRIFPAKNMICERLKMGAPLAIFTEGARQAHEYDLSQFAVFGASNSAQPTIIPSTFNMILGELMSMAQRLLNTVAITPVATPSAKSREYERISER